MEHSGPIHPPNGPDGHESSVPPRPEPPTDEAWNHPSLWSDLAEQAFERARHKARREDRYRRSRGENPCMKSFFEVLGSGIVRPVAEGVRAIDISRIVGSVAKPCAFTRSFQPRSDDLRARWKRAYGITRQLRGYDPVDLYRVGEEFFVEDGHFRISVVKSLGGRSIEASITNWV